MKGLFNSRMMNRAERRRRTARKLAQRKRLMGMLGKQGGLIYAIHREKIDHSIGYMNAGNVSHYVAVKPSRKTRCRNRHNKVYQPSIQVRRAPFQNDD